MRIQEINCAVRVLDLRWLANALRGKPASLNTSFLVAEIGPAGGAFEVVEDE